MGQELAPKASCYVSVTFTPSRAGTRKGTLTVLTSGPKVSTSLSGVGLAPKVLSASSKSKPQPALGQVTFKVSGYAPASLAPAVVTFTEKLTTGKPGLDLTLAAGQDNGGLISVVIPPVVDPVSGEPEAGSATVGVGELLQMQSGTTTLSAQAPLLKITMPPRRSAA